MNAIVILFWSVKYKADGHIHSASVMFLGIADLLTGVYMAIIAFTDIYYKGRFHAAKLAWKASHMCKIAGLCTFLSIEISSIVLLTLSVVRLLAISNPFERQKSNTYLIVLIIMWLFFTGLGSILVFSEILLQNDLCFILDLTHISIIQSFKSKIIISLLVTFLIINLLCLVGGLICNIVSVIYLRRAKKEAGQQFGATDRKLAIRIILVCVSNFLSWIVVIPVTILSISGYHLDNNSLSWVVTVALPMNSILNPVLYTFATPAFKKSFKLRATDTTTVTQNSHI